ncbi:MAG: rane protein [Chitinophagaceae bacterium]|nr:rane protein [Chitinophagaceae bacterium]
MPKWLRALIAGYGAKKLGGGCLSTILVFVIIYYALGTCNRPRQVQSPQHGSLKIEHHSVGPGYAAAEL